MIDVWRLDEGQAGIFTLTFVDENDDPIVKADVASIALTYYAPEHPEVPIINVRQAQPVFDDNDCTYGLTDGLFTWNVQKEDAPIVNPERETELHRALVVLTTTTGLEVTREAEIRVRNLHYREVV